MFEDLKSWYRANVISRLDALENAKASYSASPEESVSSIRRIAHSLKGSGKTYGFPEISEAAARVESASDEKAMETLDDLLAILHKISADRKELQYILVIEEDPDISHLLHLILTNQNCHCQNVHTAAEAHQAIVGRRFDMIVMDLDLPDMDGRNFLVQLREDARTAVLPILVLSARTAKHFESECLVLGADAYYTKPFDPKIFSAAVTSLLERAKQVSRLTLLDQMTNLPNRAAFRNYYDHIIAHHPNPPVPRTMALLDIDYLESINEKFGKGAGNQIITQIASFIREQEQDRFYCARWKGGSFIFVFPNYDEEAVVSWMMSLKTHLEQNPLPIRESQYYSASFSASVADISGIIPFGEAISLTEDLLFLAKSVGRNRILTPKDKLTPLLKRVLLADDDELIASIVKHRLTREGFEVHHAPDGEEALRMAKMGTYSLVILDVKMPVFDGFELVKLLREMPTYSKTPIMMLTSLGEDKDIVRGLNLGANDYMLKPFSPLELIARVRRMLKS